jgi:MtrB/PioB family decaheme-associated outer membrane protein
MKDIYTIVFFAALALKPLPGLTATGVIDLSVLFSDEDSAEFGEYSDLADSGGKLIGAAELTGDLPWSVGTAYWQMEGENLGLQSYDFSYTITEPSRYKIKLTFDGTQQYTRLNSRTPFIRGQDNTFTLPNNWVAATTSAGMIAFDSTAIEFDEEVHRDLINLAINLTLTEHWQFDATYQRLNRQGTQSGGGAIYFDASTAFTSILPVGIDEDSAFFSTSLTFSNDRLINTISYLVSKFDDRNDQLIWTNPFLISDNTNISYPNGSGSLSLSPDNDREELRATGSYHPDAIHGFNVQWDAAWSETQQAGSLLPYTVNPALNSHEPRPTNRLDTRLELFNGNLRLTYRPPGKMLRRLVLRSSYSVDDRNQDKNRMAFNYIRGDAAADQPGSILGIYANAHDFRKQRSLIAGDYRLPWWHSKGSLAFERLDVERQNAAVSATETDTVRGTFRFALPGDIGVRIEAALSDRSAGTYEWGQSFLANRTSAFIAQTPVDQRFDNHPLLSQFHLANAETQDLEMMISYTGFDRWSFNVDLQQQNIDYDKTVLGLRNADTSYYGIDVQFFASEHFTGYGMASRSLYETRAAGRSFGGGIEKPANRIVPPLPQASDPARNWVTNIDDEVLTVSTGLFWQSLETLSTDINYTFVRTESEFLAETGGSANLDATGLPDLETALHVINLSVTYQINHQTDMTISYRYFDYEESDWATRGVAFDSVPDLLGAEQSSRNGDVNLLGVSFQHRF